MSFSESDKKMAVAIGFFCGCLLTVIFLVLMVLGSIGYLQLEVGHYIGLTLALVIHILYVLKSYKYIKS